MHEFETLWSQALGIKVNHKGIKENGNPNLSSLSLPTLVSVI